MGASNAGTAARAVLTGVLCALAAGEAAAQPEASVLPLWEARLGATALYAPDYPGADETQWRAIGAPLFVYRGERLRIGADEPNAVARAIAVETKRFELDLSADANFGAESDDSEARAGMPDLDHVVEIGPQATLNLIDRRDQARGRTRLRLLLPVRTVGATDFKSYEDLGYVAQPMLHYRREMSGPRRCSYSAALGASWASEGVQDYYYEVAPAYAAAARPAYDAEGGYMGAHLQLSAMREARPGLNLYLTYRLREYSGAANQDSPLHRDDATHAVSVSAVWTVLRSSRPARDTGE